MNSFENTPEVPTEEYSDWHYLKDSETHAALIFNEKNKEVQLIDPDKYWVQEEIAFYQQTEEDIENEDLTYNYNLKREKEDFEEEYQLNSADNDVWGKQITLKEFTVNKYLSVALVEDYKIDIIILVNGQEFRICTSLFLNIPLEDYISKGFKTIRRIIRSMDQSVNPKEKKEDTGEAAELINETHSIDKQEKKLFDSLNYIYTDWDLGPDYWEFMSRYDIDPETIFWGICSNLQAWSENNYDTRLLERSIAFPLLKGLALSGDLKAKEVFKGEIVRRLASGYPSVLTYLSIEGYLNYLEEEDFQDIIFHNPNSEFYQNLKQAITNRSLNDLIPVLKKLGKLGVDTALVVLEELITRRESYFSNLLDSETECNILIELENSYKFKFQLLTIEDYMQDLYYDEYKNNFCVKDKHIFGLRISHKSFINSRLPESICKLKTLRILDLIFNKLTSLPESLGELKSLQKLNLAGNRFSSLPNSIVNLKSLRDLNLSKNMFTVLPESLIYLSSLEKLNFSENSLVSLPEWIGSLKAIKNINLYRTKLSSLPESIGNLKTLRELNLSWNHLQVLPETIGNLSSLTKLNIWSNNLLNLPESFKKLESLQELDLSWKTSTLPEMLWDFKALKRLHIANSDELTALPEEIGNLRSLQSLELLFNRLSSLPESIGSLSSLKKLYLTGNVLTTLPESIGNLSSLKVLVLYDNPLTTLPESIGNLTSLQKLVLDGKKLITLPESIKTLKKRGIIIYKTSETILKEYM